MSLLLCRVADAGHSDASTRATAGVGNWPRDEIAEGGAPRVRRYGDYMSGGTVKPNFCGLFLPCFLAFTLSFVRPRRRLSSAPTVESPVRFRSSTSTELSPSRW